MSLNVQLIRDSFELAKPMADKVADKFYEFLWGDFPASKGLFEGVKMKNQKKALIGSLVYIVDHVDKPDELVPYLQKMGERHNAYGTEAEHYDWVGQSLLKTFAFFLEDAWTAELEEQWTLAYTFIAQTMLEGANNSTPEIGELKSRAKDICHSLLVEILEEGIDVEFEQYVRAKVRRVLFKILEEESRELLKKAA